MCGLIGAFTAEKIGFQFADINDFKHMMIINSMRGAHSTGVAGVDSRKWTPPAFIKGEGNPYDVFKYNKSKEFFDLCFKDFNIIMGHGRFATQGEVNAKNAHPFTEDHITLVHNGTISNFKALQGTDYTHYEVDSQLIARLIADTSAEEVIPKLYGAYVLIWYNHMERTLNIARNHSRPLFIGLKSNSDTIFWSSEKETLEWNAKRNKTPLKEIYEMPVNEIHTYYEGDLSPTITKVKYSYTPPVKVLPQRSYWDEFDDALPPVGVNVFPFDSLRSKDIKPKTLSKVLNNKEKQKSYLKGSPRILAVGESYTFEIGDVLGEGHTRHIVGTNPHYPAVEFVSNAAQLSDDDIYDADYATGVIYQLNPALPSDKFFDYRVILANVKLGKDIEEEEPEGKRFKIMSFEGVIEEIPQFRFREMLSTGCAWCHGTHDERSEPSKVLVQDNKIVCEECSETLLSNYVSEHLKAKRKGTIH